MSSFSREALEYQGKIDSSIRTYAHYATQESMFDAFSVRADEHIHRIRDRNGSLCSVRNPVTGVAQRLFGLILPPSGELHGLIAFETADSDTGIAVSRIPYDNQPRAELLGLAVSDGTINIKPSERAQHYKPDTADWHGYVELRDDGRRIGFEHVGPGKTNLLLPHSAIELRQTAPLQLWAPESRLILNAVAQQLANTGYAA